MPKITGRQSMAARSLLKWNLHDLANRVKGMQTRRIDSFEQGVVHLMGWEYDELYAVFTKAGIVFKPDLDVVLKKEQIQRETLVLTSGEGNRIVLDAKQNVISDTTAEKTSLIPVKPRPEEDSPKD